MNFTELKAKQAFFKWHSFCVINCVIGCSNNVQSPLKYFIPLMYSLNCVQALEWQLVAYSPSLSYYSQILALKAPKDSSIKFSSIALCFLCFAVVICFVKTGRTTEIRIKQNLSFSNISNSSSLLRFNIFIFFFLRLFYTKLTQK